MAAERTEILISGFGGQGVIRMGQTIGLAAIRQGLRVTMLKSHGTETRGGYVRAQVVIAAEDIDSPVVEHADYFVAFSAAAYKRFFELCRGQVLYDPAMVAEIRSTDAGRHVAVAATAISQERFGKTLFANAVMLGALCELAGMDRERTCEALLETVPRFHEENRQAFEAGCRVGAQARAGAA